MTTETYTQEMKRRKAEQYTGWLERTDTPSYYITWHDHNGYALIYQGQPVCNNKKTYTEVMAAALQFAANQFKPQIHEDYYNGVTGSWQPIDQFSKPTTHADGQCDSACSAYGYTG